MLPRFHRLRTTTCFCLCINIALAGCAFEVAQDGSLSTDDEPVGVSENALMGGTDFVGSTCSTEQRAVLRHAGLLGRTIASTAAFRECVSTTMRDGNGPRSAGWKTSGPYRPCQWDPYRDESQTQRINRVIGIVNSPNVTQIECRDLSVLGRTGQAPYGDYAQTSPEVMHLSTPVLDDAYLSLMEEGSLLHRLGSSSVFFPGVVTAAQTIWHEAMHSHGYAHDDKDVECRGQEPQESVPNIVGACLESVWVKSGSKCDPSVCAERGPSIAVVTSYQGDKCQCVRDPVTSFNPSLDDPGTPPPLDTNETSDIFGSVTAKGDFNGDGFDDLAIGALGEDQTRGAVFVFQGTAFGLYPWMKLTDRFGSARSGDYYGASLAAADFNGDGYDDLTVGMPQTGSGAGAVILFVGGPRGPLPRSRLGQAPIGSDETGDEFGRALAAGDFDGDGFSDLAVGAPNEKLSGDGPRSGFVYVLRGAANASVLTMWAGARQGGVDADSDGDRFGETLTAGRLGLYSGTGASRLNDALIVGAPADGGRGKVFFFTSALKSTSVAWKAARFVQPSGLANASRFGAGLSIGRYVAPSYGFVAIGAPRHGTTSRPRTGQVYVYDDYGTLRQVETQTRIDMQFGGALATASISGSNYEDLVVGAIGTAGINTVAVFSGGPVLTQTLTLTQQGMGADEVSDLFGGSVVAGDFDGDGNDDLAVGAPWEAPGSDPQTSGSVFTWRGGSNGKLTPLSVFDQED